MGSREKPEFPAHSLPIYPDEFDIHVDLTDYTLRDAIQLLSVDRQSDIPLMIWLLENPNSPVALPGKVDLYGHDCMHAILNLGSHALPVEAFVLGFTMGNDDQTKWLHQLLFKLISSTLYPNKYRFSWKDFRWFDDGFVYGRSLSYRNLNHIDFKPYEDHTIAQLRQQFGLMN